MRTLFKVETDRVLLTWSERPGQMAGYLGEPLFPPGRLDICGQRKGMTFGKQTWRASVPEVVANQAEEKVGPRLYEQTDYSFFLQAKSSGHLAVKHRDPLVCSGLIEEEHGRTLHGTINFRSQVGRSSFTVLVDNQPEFDFEVEVFPTKLDYRTDYEQLLAEVQEILTGLALEYLRATYQTGRPDVVPRPTHPEWLTLLRHVIADLERALQQIAQRPTRTLVREPTLVRAERVRRLDSATRAALRRGAGSGTSMQLETGLVIRQTITEQRAQQTLATPEHRWIATQLGRIRRRVGQLRHEESMLQDCPRRRRILEELDAFESTIARLGRLEPFALTEGEPPSGFASLQLLGAPGYREAYQACLVLACGLRIEGGPLRLSTKDLSLLYEYWCYLALLRLVSEVTDVPISAERLFAIRRAGVHVLLEKGRETAVPFGLAGGRQITVTYNRQFSGDSYLIAQQPDILITFSNPGWRPLHLILDAKYRVDGSPDYLQSYGSYGPPEDALNLLHRYRDAILEYDGADRSVHQAKHTVVQAAAAFPYRESTLGQFGDSKLWKALDRLGVGAIPLLPGDSGYLREWLLLALRRGGWALADRAISHRGREQVRDWRAAASEPVLIGVLSEGHERVHLDWIREEKLYYMPRLKTQMRQYAAKWVAFYSPTALRKPGAVTHYASVQSVDVMKRADILTPWVSERGADDDLYVVYRLGQLKELSPPIENRGEDGRGQRFSQHRWTSRLGLHRAVAVEELSLETEPEWRLVEDLRALQVAFLIQPGRPTVLDPDDPTGRAWVVTINGTRVRYAGASGFLVRKPFSQDVYLAHLEDVLPLVADLAHQDSQGRSSEP